MVHSAASGSVPTEREAWAVGQAVVLVDSSMRSRGTVITHATITKIGRKWITVGEGWSEQRFHFDGRGEHFHGPALYRTEAEYHDAVALRKAWGAFREEVSRRWNAPAHLDRASIRQMHEAIVGAALDAAEA